MSERQPKLLVVASEQPAGALATHLTAAGMEVVGCRTPEFEPDRPLSASAYDGVVLHVPGQDVAAVSTLLTQIISVEDRPVLVLAPTVSTALEDAAIEAGAEAVLATDRLTPELLGGLIRQSLARAERRRRGRRHYFHELNNLLAIVNGYSDLLRGRISEQDASFQSLSEIREAGERAGELSRLFLGGNAERMPESAPVGESPEPSTADPASVPDVHATVLVVDDERMVRGLVREILAAQGYEVLQAESGPAALALLEDAAKGIDLLLTDVVMPDMNGRELAEQATALRPQLRVLFMSGFTDDAILRHGVSRSDVAFIAKPFTPAALISKITATLAADPTPPPKLPSSDLSSLRVACVDDSPLIRNLLGMLLKRVSDLEVVGVEESAEGIRDLLQQEDVDVLVLDYQLGDVNGGDVMAQLRQDRAADGRSTPAILFCTGEEDAGFAAEASSLGAVGVVPKSRLAAELVSAIRAAARGERWFHPGD
jgi:DNA-binding NarL/FixJ family response regulator